MIKDVVNRGSYLIAIVTILVLCTWSITHIWTKSKDSPHFTDLHATLTAIYGSCLSLLLVTVMYKAGK